MGNDKTSWLDLDDDDDNLEDTGFTESIPASQGEATHVPASDSGQTDVRTVLEPSTEKTEIYHAGKAGQFEGTGDFDPMTDPIVGWLVVVKGPGLGRSVGLGSGMNTIGRDSDARTSLPFGDTLISGDDHLRIIYDDANRSFFLAPGSGRNISRANGQIVAQTMPLETHSLIELSKQTHVRFVAFCTEAFDWSDLPSDEGKPSE